MSTIKQCFHQRPVGFSSLFVKVSKRIRVRCQLSQTLEPKGMPCIVQCYNCDCKLPRLFFA